MRSEYIYIYTYIYIYIYIWWFHLSGKGLRSCDELSYKISFIQTYHIILTYINILVSKTFFWKVFQCIFVSYFCFQVFVLFLFQTVFIFEVRVSNLVFHRHAESYYLSTSIDYCDIWLSVFLVCSKPWHHSCWLYFGWGKHIKLYNLSYNCITTVHLVLNNDSHLSLLQKSSIAYLTFLVRFLFWLPQTACIYVHSVMSDSLWPRGL